MLNMKIKLLLHQTKNKRIESIHKLFTDHLLRIYSQINRIIQDAHLQVLRMVMLLFVIMQVCGGGVIAQLDLSSNYRNAFEDTLTSQITVFADLDQNATSVTNAMINEVYFGEGIISNDLKANFGGRIGKRNRIGLNANFGAIVRLAQGSRTSGNAIEVMVGTQYFAAVGIRGDLLNLASFGNKQFEDQTATFDGTAGTYVASNYLGCKIHKELKNQNRFFGGLTLHRILDYQKVSIVTGSLYTAPYGEYLDAQVNFRSIGSLIDTSTFSPALGVTVNAGFEMNLSNGKGKVRFVINQLGAAFLSNVQEITLDSSIRFEGVQINNVLSPDLDSVTDLSGDYLFDNFGGKRESKNHVASMPARLGIQFQSSISEKLLLQASLEQLLIKGFAPRVMITPILNPNNKLSWYFPISVGGYAALNVGAGLHAQIFSNQVSLDLIGQNINALPLGKNWSGQGVSVRINYLF